MIVWWCRAKIPPYDEILCLDLSFLDLKLLLMEQAHSFLKKGNHFCLWCDNFFEVVKCWLPNKSVKKIILHVNVVYVEVVVSVAFVRTLFIQKENCV